MKQWKVVFEIFRDNSTKGREIKIVGVEAGTKKLAAIRAMSVINKMEGYENLFKQVKSVEEVI